MLSNKSYGPPRIDPVTPPYPPDLQAALDQLMLSGVPPSALLTTLARVPRIWDRFRAGSLLDGGPLSLRDREIVIIRTSARCRCAYEWGTHVAIFARRAGLTPEQVHAIVVGNADDAVWSDEDQLLIRLADELHDTASISNLLWKALVTSFSVEQIFELIALVGFYHTASFFANGLRLGAEPYPLWPPASKPA